MVDPVANLTHLRARIDEAARRAQRDPAEIELIAISKVHGAERISPVIAAGHTLFGENRVQEAQAKWPAVREGREGLHLHLVGPLQTNKVRDAVALFDAIHSLDRPKLAEALAREVERSGRAPELFIQINTGEEAQKSGVLPLEADGFIAMCRDTYNLPVKGLMAIPPLAEPPAPHFALLREIARANGLEGLSMGMTGDFEEAIAQGATHIRVGTAVFGERPAKT
ncbi:MAG: YggS family pyridoxal phosphate-dependent enzyme [Pseudomonadota bacterium]